MSIYYIIIVYINNQIINIINKRYKELTLIIVMLITITTIYEWNELGIYYTSDSISDVFIILTIFIIPIAIISNWNNINNKIYYELIINILIILILNLMCQDMITFYIFYEISLIPLYIIISLYGSNNKSKAIDYILIYTLMSSLFMLIGIVIYYIIINNTDYNIISIIILSIDLQCIIYISIWIGLGVKTPLIPLHTWLPVVHSESPVGGSIILAGIILKLSIYGLIRLIIPVLSDANILNIPLIYIICLITIIYTSLITLRQTDLKVIIAYSSISHMAICILGLLSNNIYGIYGSILLSLAHGLISPGLFIIVGGILYDRFHNRLLFYFQGLINIMPKLSLFLLIFSFCNIGLPLSLNFIGELLCIVGTFNKNFIIGFIISITILLSASYQMKLTNRLSGGIMPPYLSFTTDISFRESILLFSLIIPTFFLGLFPSFLFDFLFILNHLLFIYSYFYWN